MEVKYHTVVPEKDGTPIAMFNQEWFSLESVKKWKHKNLRTGIIEEYTLKII